MENTQVGIMIMKRDTVSYKSSFCIVKSQLVDLEKQNFLLHPNEQSYYNSLKFDKRKLSYLLGRIASKNAINILCPDLLFKSIEIGIGVFGFPVVKCFSNRTPQVSISHCDEYGIAIAYPEEHPMGIDIEKIANDKLNTMKNFMDNEIEKQLIRELVIPEITGYTMLWTIKESLSKILKTGFTLSSEILQIKEIEICSGVYVSLFKHFTQYKTITFCEEGFACSLVLPRNTMCDWERLKKAIIELINVET